MIKYKLLEVLKPSTLTQIVNIFGIENIFKFTDNIVGIKYDCNKMTYEDVLINVVSLNLRQWVMTFSRFMDIIDYAIIHSLNIKEIIFYDHIDSYQSNKIKAMIAKMNKTSNAISKMDFKNNLVDRLEWLVLDKSIDIKSIVMSYSTSNSTISTDGHFFNNGVLVIEKPDLIENIRQLFVKCF